MSLSEFLSGLFGQSGVAAPPDSPDRPRGAGEGEQPTIIHECRSCGTSVAAKTRRCPACEGNDIVTYSIE